MKKFELNELMHNKALQKFEPNELIKSPQKFEPNELMSNKATQISNQIN